MGIEVYLILFFIGTIAFFFWKWLLKRLIRNPERRRIAIWSCTLISTPIAYAIIIWLFILGVSYYPKHEFDSKKWKSHPETRYELTDDLISSKLLIGKTKAEVENLLGKSTNFEANEWVYMIGFLPGMFKIDPDIIEIWFQNNKVVKIIQRGT